MCAKERLEETRRWVRDMVIRGASPGLTLKALIASRPLYIVTPPDGRNLNSRSRATGGVRKADVAEFSHRESRMQRMLGELVGSSDEPFSDQELSEVAAKVQSIVPESVCTRDFDQCILALNTAFERGTSTCYPMVRRRRIWWFWCIHEKG